LSQLQGIRLVDDAKTASLQLAAAEQPASQNGVDWVYALVAPFPTITDGVSLADLKNAWDGEDVDGFDGAPLLMSPETQAVLSVVWGKPGENTVTTFPADKLLQQAWAKQPSWAIVPFEEIGPRWKVLNVDGISPLDRSFDPAAYPLSVHYGLEGPADVQASFMRQASTALQSAGNRDDQKLTVIELTGTTALVRHTAQRMEEKGVLYPAEKIRDILLDADLTHISNEVSFDENCPPANPVRLEMRFCSSPGYIDLLKDIGADLIELTGNHELDWGADPFRYTLDLYKREGFAYYGGGADVKEAQKPYLYEHNGTRLAFIGCNSMGPEEDFVKDGSTTTLANPGSLECDMDWMKAEIGELKSQGYLPIVTFQHFEMEDFKPQSGQRVDFQAASQAGAEIVSGSQSHFPQTVAFNGNQFIHYGLGNLFFDQMTGWNRQGFIDRHYFYDGKYIGTQLVTVMLEDYAQPRLMTDAERAKLLTQIFQVGGG
jgi:poly-gamma-glutamate synthesis protein (capsule biosynthesis protein)